MALSMGYTDPTKQGGDNSILPAGQHAVVLASVKVEENDDLNNPGQTKEQFRFTFESLKPMADGKPGIISLWTGLNYGSTKAHLTKLLNTIFGRPLSQDEVRQMDIEKLVGIKGYALVAPGTKQDGTPKSVFSSWLHPEKRPLPDITAFFNDGVQAAPPSTRAAQTEPEQIAPGSKADPFAEHAEGDIPDPFGGDDE